MEKNIENEKISLDEKVKLENKKKGMQLLVKVLKDNPELLKNHKIRNILNNSNT